MHNIVTTMSVLARGCDNVDVTVVKRGRPLVVGEPVLVLTLAVLS